MSASEGSGQNSFTWTGPYAVPDHPGLARAHESGMAVETCDTAGRGEVHVLPTPYAQRALAASRATARVRRAAAGGAAVGAAAALLLAYALGRRAGRRSARHDLGPVALLLGRRL
ncbi:hypothetical protein ACFCWY_06960 [Streptomyces sp. NPDC056362]|uniref:hypothetical protein n=1 Tax=unclassified Streptomyces TaxID=2593676 RepID=UPI0035D83E49